jgi:ACS family pantothenate transporter-like MFS transporter
MNEMAYVIQAWLPLIVWQQVNAPQYRKGFVTITFLSFALIVTALVTRLLHGRELSKKRNDQEIAVRRSSSSGNDSDVIVTANLDGKL